MAFHTANPNTSSRRDLAGPGSSEPEPSTTATLQNDTAEPNARPTVTGNADGGQPENRAFYPALDGLRWFAFTLVFGNHYLQLPWGFGGVNFFFVLSGFLITGILLDTEHHRYRLRNFYLRRTLRIFPLYYAILLALLLTTPLFHWQWSSYWVAWPLYLGNVLTLFRPHVLAHAVDCAFASNGWLRSPVLPNSTLNLGAFWSLCVEEQFYLVWPFLLYAIRDRTRLLHFCLIAAPAVLLLRVAVQNFGPAWVLPQFVTYRFTLLRVDGLLLGAAIALLWRSRHRERLQRMVAWFAPALTVITLICLFHNTTLLHLEAWQQWQPPAWAFTWGLGWVDLFAVCAVVLCLNPRSYLARVFNLAPLRALGRLTYGAYIFHDIFHNALFKLAAPLYNAYSFRTAFFIVRIGIYALTFATAWLSFRFFETPFLRLKDRYTRHA